MYPNYPHFAVAITRTCGSGGGSYIGKKLAKDFDIDLYDRKLLRLAACCIVYRSMYTMAALSRRKAATSSATRICSTIRPRSCGNCWTRKATSA